MRMWEHVHRELVTPPLDGTILPGVTRDCVLTLARGWGEFEVSERQLSIGEVKQVRCVVWVHQQIMRLLTRGIPFD